MTLITEEMVQTAFDWLNDNAAKAAQAKSKRIRAEHMLKRAKAEAFLAASGTVAEREAIALCSPEYDEALDEECRAVQLDEWYRNQHNKCGAIIDGWRTESATNRSLGKIG
jgi:hypothetical protein